MVGVGEVAQAVMPEGLHTTVNSPQHLAEAFVVVALGVMMAPVAKYSR